jgi:hypothetical protein
VPKSTQAESVIEVFSSTGSALAMMLNRLGTIVTLTDPGDEVEFPVAFA